MKNILIVICSFFKCFAIISTEASDVTSIFSTTSLLKSFESNEVTTITNKQQSTSEDATFPPANDANIEITTISQGFTSFHEFLINVTPHSLITNDTNLRVANESRSWTGNTKASAPQMLVHSTTKEAMDFVDIGPKYWVKAVMQIPRWIDINNRNFTIDMQTRLRNLISAAVERQQSFRYLSGSDRPQQALQNAGLDRNEFIVQILNITRQERGNNIQSTFLTKYKQFPMTAEILMDDLRLLNTAEQSAVIGYPVVEMKTYLAEQETENRNLWIIGAVIGSVLGILFCGWCILFAYYNTCGRVFQYGHEPYDQKQSQEGMQQKESGPASVNTQQQTVKTDEHEVQSGRRQKVEKIYLISTDVQTDFDTTDQHAEQRNPNFGRNEGVQVHMDANQSGGVHRSNSNISSQTDAPNAKLSQSAPSRLLSPNGKTDKKSHQPTIKIRFAHPDASGDNATVHTMDSNADASSSNAMIPSTPQSGKQLSVIPEMGSKTASTPADAGKDTDHIMSPIQSQNVNDIWTLYPWRPYQAADQSYWLTQQFTADNHPTPYQTTGPDGLVQEIKARNAEFMKAFESGNAAAAAAMYADDCHFMPHGREGVKGKSGVEAYFKQDMMEGVKSVNLTTEEVNGEGSWAFERGVYRLDGTRGSETGSYLIIWKKVNGKWHIYNDCFNVIKPAQGC